MRISFNKKLGYGIGNLTDTWFNDLFKPLWSRGNDTPTPKDYVSKERCSVCNKTKQIIMRTEKGKKTETLCEKCSRKRYGLKLKKST